MEEQTDLEKVIGYKFKDQRLLKEAITHISCFNEKKDKRRSDNEKLEYLGDAVLNCLISILLYSKFKGKDEGFLSNARSVLVRKETLTEIALDIGLNKHINYGNGDDLVPEASKVLSNMFEALIGAVYLDGGILKTKGVIKRLFLPYFKEERLTEKNPKNSLQEYSQKKWGLLPKYKFSRKTKNGFSVTVFVGNHFRSKGEGKSKKEAEQQAAKRLLEEILKAESG
ncbi:MAG: ribonuclease III [Syntrophorhabdaceae bacterium]|nr:ribonuclease III [Syntrophorhabdaceae bacterium]